MSVLCPRNDDASRDGVEEWRGMMTRHVMAWKNGVERKCLYDGAVESASVTDGAR